MQDDAAAHFVSPVQYCSILLCCAWNIQSSPTAQCLNHAAESARQSQAELISTDFWQHCWAYLTYFSQSHCMLSLALMNRNDIMFYWILLNFSTSSLSLPARYHSASIRPRFPACWKPCRLISLCQISRVTWSNWNSSYCIWLSWYKRFSRPKVDKNRIGSKK